MEADEEKNRGERQQTDHERRALADPDREQAGPHEQAEHERPDEGRDAGVNRRGAEVQRGRNYTGPKKFAEPVSLPSTASADLPLPGTALRFGFVLLALCARRKQDTNAFAAAYKGRENAARANCVLFFYE